MSNIPSLGLQTTGALSAGLLLSYIPAAMCSDVSSQEKDMFALQNALDNSNNETVALASIIKLSKDMGRMDLLEKMLRDNKDRWMNVLQPQVDQALIAKDMELLRVFVNFGVDLANMVDIWDIVIEERPLNMEFFKKLFEEIESIEFLFAEACQYENFDLLDLLLKDGRVEKEDLYFALSIAIDKNQLNVAQLLLADDRVTPTASVLYSIFKLPNRLPIIKAMLKNVSPSHIEDIEEAVNQMEDFSREGYFFVVHGYNKLIRPELFEALKVIRSGEAEFNLIDHIYHKTTTEHLDFHLVFTFDQIDILLAHCNTPEQRQALTAIQNELIKVPASYGPSHPIREIISFGQLNGLETAALKALVSNYSRLDAHRINSVLLNQPVEIQYEILKNL